MLVLIGFIQGHLRVCPGLPRCRAGTVGRALATVTGVEEKRHYFFHEVCLALGVQLRVLFCRDASLLVLWMEKMGFHWGALIYLFIRGSVPSTYIGGKQRRKTNPTHPHRSFLRSHGLHLSRSSDNCCMYLAHSLVVVILSKDGLNMLTPS